MSTQVARHTTKQLYRYFIEDSLYRFCWACGRSGSFGDKPAGWYGPFGLDRAHIVNKPRIEDVRLVNILCCACHRVSRGERLVLNGEPWPLPPLTVAHMLWLKKRFDPDNFDREFIQRYSVQRLPKAQRPPLVYRLAYHRRHPGIT